VNKLTKEETEVESVDEGKSYRSGDEKYSDIKKVKKDAHARRLDRKNKRQVEEEVEELDELSSATLGSYVRKASKQVYHAATMGKGGEQKDMVKIANKRLNGVQNAADRIQNKKD